MADFVEMATEEYLRRTKKMRTEMMASGGYMSASAIGKILGLHKLTVIRMIKRGDFEGVLRIGTEERVAYRVPRKAFQAYLEQHQMDRGA